MKPALVLASSLGTTTQLWEGNAPYWADRFRLVRYVQPGRASIDELGRDLLRMLDEAGLDRASICGVSLGGATAMWVAANEPGRIDRLVLACTSARFGVPGQWLERATTVREKGLEPIADSIVARWFTPRAPTELVAGFREQLARTTPLSGAELLADGIPDAKLVVVRDAAHLANVEQPEVFSRLVLDHVAARVEVA